MYWLTGERHETLIGGLQPPLEHTHVLVDGEGAALLLHGNHSLLVELCLVHVGMSLHTHSQDSISSVESFGPNKNIIPPLHIIIP